MRLATICSSRLLIPIFVVAALAQAWPAGGQDLVEVGSMPYGPCYATTFNKQEKVAFLGNGSVLQALDLSDPYAPALVGELRLPGAVHHLLYSGEELYVANGHGGLRVVTMEVTKDKAGVITKVEFTELGSVVEGLRDARHLDIVNDRVYIANGRYGLAVVDVQDPAKPILSASSPLAGEAREVAMHLASGQAYVAAGTDGLFIVNVKENDPGYMQQVSHSLDVIDVSSVDLAGSELCILDRTKGLCVVTGLNTGTPVQHAYLDTLGGKVSVTVYNEGTLNGSAYVADGELGISLIDISDPASLALLTVANDLSDHLDTPGNATRVYMIPYTSLDDPNEIRLHSALVADDNGGLQILGKTGGVNDAGGLWKIGAYDTPGLARGIAISGEVAYIADGDGVRVFDISSPLAFPELGMVVLDKDFHGITASGSNAFVAAQDGLHLVEAAKPSNITTTRIYSFSKDNDVPSRKVAAINDVISMTVGEEASDQGLRLCILNVAGQDLYNPRQAYPSVPTSMGVGLAADENMTYVTGSDALYALNRKSFPGDVELLPIATLNQSVRVAVLGGYAYVSDADGLCILDVANGITGPAELKARGPNQLSLTTVAVAGSAVYADGENTLHQAAYAVGDNTLHVFDVTRFKNAEGKEDVTLTELDPLILPLDKEGDILATSGNRVYAIAGAAGVRIYGVDRDAPVANAGADIAVFSGFTAYLNAEASTDDVAIMKYNWRCLNSNIEPSDADKTEARFITPRVSEPTQYEFELTVEDKAGRTSTDTMVVTVKPYTGRGESSSGSSGCTLSPEAGFRAEWLFLFGLMAVLRLRRRKR
ncbi:hypothetical protein PCS_03437 [Desulfocurvibacter africanus PCS]|uniref:Uncharacterized protein n=2 Tax=Desulfocurvibacter africanus TaxID=873 RepID=M5Q0T2_DESAF|nr:hypothetical protein PCS_03437 [Desulfocurvibacter africanus PCS]